jgi:hypothetical protein
MQCIILLVFTSFLSAVVFAQQVSTPADKTASTTLRCSVMLFNPMWQQGFLFGLAPNYWTWLDGAFRGCFFQYFHADGVRGLSTGEFEAFGNFQFQYDSSTCGVT